MPLTRTVLLWDTFVNVFQEEQVSWHQLASQLFSRRWIIMMWWLPSMVQFTDIILTFLILWGPMMKTEFWEKYLSIYYLLRGGVDNAANFTLRTPLLTLFLFACSDLEQNPCWGQITPSGKESNGMKEPDCMQKIKLWGSPLSPWLSKPSLDVCSKTVFIFLKRSRIAQLMGIEYKFDLMLSTDGSGRGAALVAATLQNQHNK